MHVTGDFEKSWRDTGRGTIRLTTVPESNAAIALEYASFVVDGRRDLSLLIFTPRANADREVVAAAVAARRRLGRADD